MSILNELNNKVRSELFFAIRGDELIVIYPEKDNVTHQVSLRSLEVRDDYLSFIKNIKKDYEVDNVYRLPRFITK